MQKTLVLNSYEVKEIIDNYFADAETDIESIREMIAEDGQDELFVYELKCVYRKKKDEDLANVPIYYV